jgi:hypothetical protein
MRVSRIVSKIILKSLLLASVDVSHSFQPGASSTCSCSFAPVLGGRRDRHSSRKACRLFGHNVKTLEKPCKNDLIVRQEGGTISPVAGDPSRTGLSTALATLTAAATSSQALAVNMPEISQGYLDPSNFNPVCPASDFFYRFLQSSAINVVGRDSFIEYGPLIAGGLLRVRLELCVVESFFNEAVIPFIKQNGLNWVLPIHETVETFLAGTGEYIDMACFSCRHLSLFTHCDSLLPFTSLCHSNDLHPHRIY